MKLTKILQPANTQNLSANAPHILLVIDSLAGSMGGGERIVIKIASLLPLYGYRASILSFTAPTTYSVLNSPPCPIYLLPITNTYSFASLQAALELRRFLREEKVQIVQTFFESSDLWAGLVTKTMSKAKLIWSRRDMGILRTRKHEIAYRMMAGFPDMVLTVSESVRTHCIKVDHIDPSRVRTIHNGIDLTDWNTNHLLPKRSGRCSITTVGNIRHVKGHDIFIKAAASVVRQFPEVSFSIAGAVLEPLYFESLQAMIHDLHLSDNFHFSGDIVDLREHLATANIFVLPSRSEGFSNAIVEAMAVSLPVVATNVGGNAEAVQDGVSGFIVPPEDAEALAAAIIRLLLDPSAAKAMGASGRKLVSERFTTEAMMVRTIETYNDLLARR